jgi:hypothetical protein
MRFNYLKFVAVVGFLIALGTLPAFTASAKENKMPKNSGEVSIKTTPAGFPIMIDGVAYGVSSDPIQPIYLPKGPHRVEVLFPGKPWTQQIDVVSGKRNCICLAYTRRALYSPCPYRPTVSAPDVVTDGDTITFTSDVSYTGSKPLAYTWTVSPSTVKIISGGDSNTITVDSTGLGGQRVTAGLRVDPGYGDEKCTAMAEAGTDITLIPPPPDRKRFDQLPLMAFDEDKARLDNFAIQLQGEPSATGYLIFYGKGKQAQADRFSKRSVDYLVQTRGIDRSRIVVINGGYSDTDFIEMWLVPQGAQPPVATPGVAPPSQPAPTRRRS